MNPLPTPLEESAKALVRHSWAGSGVVDGNSLAESGEFDPKYRQASRTRQPIMSQVDSSAPAHSPPNLDAIRFLDLHRHHLVTSWQWCFGETMLRACTDRECATIRRTDLDQLLDAGLMERGAGFSLRVPS